MKKITIILLCFTALSCSKSDDTADTPITNTDNKINLPSWLDGTYKAENISLQYPYPKSQPYSMTFKSGNDIVIKGASNSITESLQTKIDEFASTDKLISVSESYDANTTFNNYHLVITSKPISPSTSQNSISFEIVKTPLPNTIHIIYKRSYQGDFYSGKSYYILQ